MWQLVGEQTNKIYQTSRHKSEVMRWLNKKYPSERVSNSKFRKTVSINMILPEPMTIKKADQTAT